MITASPGAKCSECGRKFTRAFLVERGRCPSCSLNRMGAAPMPETSTRLALRLRKVKDLRPGDWVDLKSCPWLYDYELAEFEYAVVENVERETASCIVVTYEGIDWIGYDPDQRLIVAEHEHTLHLTERELNAVFAGLLLLKEHPDDAWEVASSDGSLEALSDEEIDELIRSRIA